VSHAKPWHARPELVTRWLSDFMVGQMRLLRPNYLEPERLAELALTSRDADIDSIELVDLASALYVALDAEASGSLDGGISLGRSFASWSAFVAHAAARAENLSFYTSGSTGKTRRIEHRVQDLDGEIEDILPTLCAHGFTPKRVVTVMPSQHLYGFLFGLMLPATLNLPMLSLKAQPAPQVRAQLQPGDILIAHPKFWTHALSPDSFADSARWPASMLGLSSGQALPDAVLTAAQKISLRLLEIYGATETAGIAWRAEPGPLTLMKRYVFSENSTLLDQYRGGAEVKPPDRIERLSERGLRVLARHDRVVQVAGVNVHLEHVERVVSTITSAVEVRVAFDADTQRLSAWLISETRDESALRAQLRALLSPAELPTRWHFVTAFPETESGKILLR
jgi:long-chain acyl-CoA synthetase